MKHWVWVLIFWWSHEALSKSYRLFEDPVKGPRALEKWKIPPRTSDEEWSHLLRLKGLTPYQVQLGDTLSKISKKELGDMNYWPKLWEVNRDQISNPHLIEPSQILLFIPNRSSERQPASENQNNNQSQSTVDNLPDQLLREDLFHSHRLRYFCMEGQKIAGVITGSYENQSTLTLNSSPYIGISDTDQVKPGAVLSVVREIAKGEVPEALRLKYGSNLVQLMGEIKIKSVKEKFATASVESAYGLLERGDFLLAIPALQMKEEEREPPGDLTAKILSGENWGGKFITVGQLVFINKGKSEGVLPGQVFGVFEDTDPYFNKQDLILPRTKGEIKIVQSGNSWSTGYVRSVSALIQEGDILIAHHLFEKQKEGEVQKRQPTYIDE